MSKVNAPPSSRFRSLLPLRHRLHRLLAVPSGLLLLYLVGTGLPLQFTASLDLASRYVSSPLILDYVGLQAPEKAMASGEVVHIGRQLYRDSRSLGESLSFLGSVSVDRFDLLLTDDALWIVALDNPDLPEFMPLPARAKRIGSRAGRVAIETDDGLFELDDDFLNLQLAKFGSEQVQWATLSPLQGDRLSRAQADYRGRMLSMERLFQELHSGRMFGALGEWLVNASTLLMTILAGSGFLIWWRTRPR